jgi:hypothetical protein
MQLHSQQHRTDKRSTPKLSFVLVGLCVTAGMLTLPAHAYSTGSKTNSTQQTTDTKAKKKGSIKVKHQRSSSEESPRDRDRRLTRECRGAPNAGACLGYARP